MLWVWFFFICFDQSRDTLDLNMLHPMATQRILDTVKSSCRWKTPFRFLSMLSLNACLLQSWDSCLSLMHVTCCLSMALARMSDERRYSLGCPLHVETPIRLASYTVLPAYKNPCSKCCVERQQKCSICVISNILELHEPCSCMNGQMGHQNFSS